MGHRTLSVAAGQFEWGENVSDDKDDATPATQAMRT